MHRLAIASFVVIVGIGAVALVAGLTQSDAPASAQGDEPLGPPAPGTEAAEKEPRPGQLDDPGQPRFSTGGWRTDFTISAVPYSEITPVLPRDQIPALDAPVFESIDDARGWLVDKSPVIALEVDGEARAYPLAILTWHEIVNDVVADVPVAVTFCPLCNTALVYDRELEGTTHTFGVSGNLRFSDLIMFDRETHTWWQQATGKGIVGDLTGAKLPFRASQIIGLDQFATTYPDGLVLSRDTGHRREYGRNPYVGYDTVDEHPFLFQGVTDGRMGPKEKVVTLGEGGAEAIAFPYSEVRRTGVAELDFRSEPVVVFWTPGANSALDRSSIDDSEDTGATGVFSRVVDGETLTFRRDGGEDAPITDTTSGSTWDITGRATDGPLAGSVLEPIPHGDHFWFAWAAFAPDTRIWTTEGTIDPAAPEAA